MPQWVLACKNCGKDFKHSDISDELFGRHIDVRGWVDKPAFPIGGEQLTCPYCDETSLYQRYMLRFSDKPIERTGSD